MCGIIYSHDFNGNPVNNNILNLYDNQRSRGTEGFGLFDGQMLNLVRATKENKILKWLVKYDSDLVLFHHRYPTSTINVKNAAHPFTTKDYFGNVQYVLIHNGVIRNSHDLRDDHLLKGIEYGSTQKDGTFNDSEALLWDVALTLEGDQKELKAYGSIAFICIRMVDGKLDKLHFARNTNPINMLRDKNGITLSSEGKGEPVDTQKLYTFNYELKRLTKRDMQIPSYDTTYTAPRTWNDGDYSSYGNYCSVGNRVDSYLNEYEDNDLDYYTEEEKPDRDDVERLAWKYMIKAQGKFENAYWLAENDYDVALDTPINLESNRQCLLLEGVMEYIQNDPEYVTVHSVSTIWNTL